jgi:hypothetical protein
MILKRTKATRSMVLALVEEYSAKNLFLLMLLNVKSRKLNQLLQQSQSIMGLESILVGEKY